MAVVFLRGTLEGQGKGGPALGKSRRLTEGTSSPPLFEDEGINDGAIDGAPVAAKAMFRAPRPVYSYRVENKSNLIGEKEILKVT